jgi:hypothetical protein
VIRLTLSEATVQAFAGTIASPVVAGVPAVLALGSRSRRAGSPQPARRDVDAMAVQARSGGGDRNGTGHRGGRPGR